MLIILLRVWGATGQKVVSQIAYDHLKAPPAIGLLTREEREHPFPLVPRAALH